MSDTVTIDPLLDSEWLLEQFGDLPEDERNWLVQLIISYRRKHLGEVDPEPEGWIAQIFADANRRAALLHPDIRTAVLRSGTANAVGS